MNLSQTRGDTRNYFFQREDADGNAITAATNISDSYVKLTEGYKH